MADEKKEIPKHIDTYLKNWEKAKQLINTTDHHHRQAYDSAVDKVIIDEKTGFVDYDLLKKAEKQLAFADHMADFYFDKAVSYFGFKKENEPLTKAIKDDVFKKDMLMRAYANVTQGHLRELVKNAKEKFSFNEFNKYKDKNFMNPLIQQLQETAGSHLTDEHIDDILKYTKSEKYFVKDSIKISQAKKLLNIHKDMGIVPEKNLDDVLAEYKVENAEYIVKPEYRSDYEPPKNKKK